FTFETAAMCAHFPWAGMVFLPETSRILHARRAAVQATGVPLADAPARCRVGRRERTEVSRERADRLLSACRLSPAPDHDPRLRSPPAGRPPGGPGRPAAERALRGPAAHAGRPASRGARRRPGRCPPAAAAAGIVAGGWDRRISSWAVRNAPVFGSTTAAQD